MITLVVIVVSWYQDDWENKMDGRIWDASRWGQHIYIDIDPVGAGRRLPCLQVFLTLESRLSNHQLACEVLDPRILSIERTRHALFDVSAGAPLIDRGWSRQAGNVPIGDSRTTTEIANSAQDPMTATDYFNPLFDCMMTVARDLWK